MYEQQADLILMPHAWPTPARAAGLVSQADVAAQQQRMTELPVLYARALGVPVVFVNQVGPLLPIGGILGHLMDTRIWRLRGQSRIVDSDGSVLGQLGEDEGVLTADVLRGSAAIAGRHVRQPGSPAAHGRQIHAGSRAGDGSIPDPQCAGDRPGGAGVPGQHLAADRDDADPDDRGVL